MSQGGGERPFVGWLLDAAERDALLERFPPRYETVVAHHVTEAYDPPELELPSATRGEIVGMADDGAGVQALVVRIGGGVGRPDGSTYHVTWSLAAGRQAWESNVLLRAGWTPVNEAVPVRLEPTIFRRP
ncbi:MAG: hypothetical protein DI570_24040 [Phenylobacterium zucineum]|nr:MAG: hypothetical protein DI570_24040 [Phenylobacterium zucineum]